MSIAFLRRAFGFKKSPEERQYEDFTKNYHLDVPVNLNNLSKIFRKNALRLIVIRNSPNSVLYDSLLNKDQPQMPSFMKGDEKITLLEAVFGAIPLSKERDVKFAMKLHDLKDSGEILISCVHASPMKRVRCTNSASYSMKANEFTQPNSINQINRPMVNPSDKAIAVCLLIKLEWIQPLAKSLHSNGLSFCLKPDFQLNSSTTTISPTVVDYVSQCLTKRFYCMLFEHFVQICVFMKALTRNIVHIIDIAEGSNFSSVTCSRLSTNPSQKFSIESHTETHDQINRVFFDFQLALRDFCIPKLGRPVWSTLCLASAAEQDEMEEGAFEPMFSVQSWKNQSLSSAGELIYGTPILSQHELLAHSFVRGCLCIQIAKAIARDKGYFLGQLITGLLMSHQGWISTVKPKEQNFQNVVNSCRNTCDTYKNRFQMGTQQLPQPPTNLLLEQLLTQFGCNLVQHECDNASLLSNSGNVFSTAILFGQQQAQRDRLLALLYICSYFLRAPFLLQSREQLPDLGRADLFELEQQRRRQVRHGSKSRRKSGSLLSSSNGVTGGNGTVVNRGYMSSDPHDSGISSQEDLTSAVYSVSAGSSPSHPIGISLCLPQRLTYEQCRLAETEAQFFVHREFHRQVGGVNNQNKFTVAEPPVPTFPNSTMPSRGHTWTAASSQTRLSSMIGLFPMDMTVPFLPTSLPSAMPTSSSSSSSGVLGGHQLTEVPLLIEKSIDNSREVCWCLGPRPNGNSLKSEPGSPSSPPSSFSVSLATSVERSPFRSGSGPVDCSSSVLTDSSDVGGVEVGTACYAGMEEFLPPTPPPDSDLVQHCQASLGVMDRFTSGLVLQATSETLDSFRPRLQAELLSWLRYAPNLVRRTIKSHSIESSQSTSHCVSNFSNFQCSALLVNVDASSVEMFTVKGRNDQQSGSFDSTGSHSSLLSQQQTPNHQSKQPKSELPPRRLTFLTRRSEEPQTFSSSPRQSQKSLDAETTVSDGEGEAQIRVRPVTPAPSVMRLLESVKLIVDRSGCSLLALKHLETGLQLLYARSRVLADLIVAEGTDLLQQPDRMAAVIGCPQGDLPLMLSIASFQSCSAAAVIQISKLDFYDLR